MKPGDILCSSRPVDAPALVELEGVPRFTARPGIANRHKALQLLSRHSQGRDTHVTPRPDPATPAFSPLRRIGPPMDDRHAAARASRQLRGEVLRRRGTDDDDDDEPSDRRRRARHRRRDHGGADPAGSAAVGARRDSLRARAQRRALAHPRAGGRPRARSRAGGGRGRRGARVLAVARGSDRRDGESDPRRGLLRACAHARAVGRLRAGQAAHGRRRDDAACRADGAARAPLARGSARPRGPRRAARGLQAHDRSGPGQGDRDARREQPGLAGRRHRR